MLSLVGNELKITRGDSAYITVNIEYADGTPYVMQAGDTLKLSAKHNLNGSVDMEVASSNSTLHITPELSRGLVVGKGFFDIQLTTSEDIFTLVGVVDQDIPNMVVYPEVTVETEA